MCSGAAAQSGVCVVLSGGEREEEGGGVEQPACTHCGTTAERAAGNTHTHTHSPQVFLALLNLICSLSVDCAESADAAEEVWMVVTMKTLLVDCPFGQLSPEVMTKIRASLPHLLSPRADIHLFCQSRASRAEQKEKEMTTLFC